MLPLPVGQEPPPQYVWAPPELTSRIRRTCTAVGVVLLVAGPLLGVLLAVLAYRLPTARHAFNTGLVLMGVLTGAFVLICGFGLVGARGYVLEQHVNVAGTRVLRRVLVVFAAATVFVAGFATLLLLAMVDGSQAGFPVGYLLLILAGPALAVTGTAIGYRRLRPPAGPR